MKKFFILLSFFPALYLHAQQTKNSDISMSAAFVQSQAPQSSLIGSGPQEDFSHMVVPVTPRADTASQQTPQKEAIIIKTPASGRPVVPANDVIVYEIPAQTAPKQEVSQSQPPVPPATPKTQNLDNIKLPSDADFKDHEEASQPSAVPGKLPGLPQTQPQKPVTQTETRRDYSQPTFGWTRSLTSNFNIFTDNRSFGISTPNMGMAFEQVHATLKMNIPWPMPPKTNVYIYKNRQDYVNGEFKPYKWSEAVFFPTYATIVFYNTLGDTKNLKRTFSHEFTHMINDSYFNPDGKGKGAPLWIDEGMAVNMEDVSNSPAGDLWAMDLLNIDIRAYNDKGGSSSFSSFNQSGKNKKSTLPVLYFAKFSDFVKDGSLAQFNKDGKTQEWYLQAYAMVRFLWKPYNGNTPENQIKFRKFMMLLAEGEQQRHPTSNMPIKDKDGKNVFNKVSVEDALGKAYGIANMNDFENKFWRWMKEIQSKRNSTQQQIEKSTTLGSRPYNSSTPGSVNVTSSQNRKTYYQGSY
ncbi:hypothetical protein Dip510_001283 [Elusimicrobium posterum]|uniref:hypothetical protein n=1 Tax=Elusimicrobium posterum TaxID=3116653 RepID=UPI003C706BBA